MNRARIALFLHLDRVTWEKGRWSSCWNPFPKPSIGQFGELRFRDYSDLSGSLLVARCNGEIIEEEAVLRSGGDAVCPPILADGHACLSFTLGEVRHADGRWRADAAGCTGRIVGAVTHADSAGVERPSMVGAYFRAGGLPAFTSIPVHELTNRAIPVEDVLGPSMTDVAARLADVDESARIEVLESLLIEQLGEQCRPNASVDVSGLTASIERSAGQVTVERLAHRAGISRQHLTRLFRERVGVTPKLYARLARFQSGLAYAGSGEAEDGAHAALALGYADQSHWIAEFKEFSGLTPHSFATRRWLHPFVERALRGHVRPPITRGRAL